MVIPVVSEQPDYELSSSQRRLWILSQLPGGNVAYNIPGVYELRGRLDRERLCGAFVQLLSRHEILRTVFVENEAGEIRQRVVEGTATGFEVQYEDVRGITEGAGGALEEAIRGRVSAPFELSAGPLFRAILYQIEDRRWVLVTVMHHIISDGWSFGILIRELLHFYNTEQDSGLRLPALRIQYKDYSGWQQEQLRGSAGSVHRAYWQEQLSGELPVLDIRGDKDRPLLKTYNGGSVSGYLDGETSRELKRLVHSHGSTLFMGLLAGVTGLLYRYTGQEDQVIGSPVAGREHPDLEEQIGFYVNTLALRTRMSGGAGYVDLLKRTREVTLGGYEHQSYPFDELVGDVHVHRDMSRNPLFDVMVDFRNASGESLTGVHEAEGLEIGGYGKGIQQWSKFDLVFTFAEAGEAIQTGITYNSDIYSAAFALRMQGHFRELIRSAVQTPDAPVSSLNYLGAAEREELLEGFNSTTVAYPKEQTIVTLFEEQVLRAPESVALVFEGESLSYRELNARSNQLARYLIRKGVGSEMLVPLCIDRSPEMVIGLMGILKAGAAYVPVDPSYPAERIAYMLKDIGASLIVSHSYYKELFEEQSNVFKIYMDRDLFAIEMEAAERPDIITRPSNLAYIIYTSGSTGRPKGVMIEHGGVVNLSLSQKNALQLTAGQVTLQFAPISFDASSYEIFNTLLSGGYLVIPTKETILSIDSFSELIDKHKVEVGVFPPSFLTEIRGISGKFKTIVSAGDSLSAELARYVMSKGVQLINAYGPTETTVCASLSRNPVLKDNKITIGKPISNTQIYILDEGQQLVARGIGGELCVGGVQLARGYLNLAELTLEKFISNPFKAGERLYRTGDLGRWLWDGNIEYLGRLDEQVKLRGYRIEPGEISSVLEEHPDVARSVVQLNTTEGGEKELAVYYVSNGEISGSTLRSYLNERLPQYMVPTRYIRVSAIPLTANGKTDRKALQAAGLGSAGETEYIAARTETERRLSSIFRSCWAGNVLG